MTASVFFESANEFATLRNVFTNEAGTAVDPSTVSLTVTAPDGTETTYTYAGSQITRNTTGDYQKLIGCSQAGVWRYEWNGTGTATDTTSGAWRVWAVGAHLYVTPEDLKSRFGVSDTNDDYEILGAVRAASRRIESYCGMPRGRGWWRDTAVTTRTFVACSGSRCLIPEGISTTTGLVVQTDGGGDGTYENTLTSGTDYILQPYNALVDGWPYTEILLADNYTFPIHSSGRAGVQITARFGWPAVPDDVREAALILAHRLFKRKESATGVVGFDGMGATVRLTRTDPDVAELLAPYVRFGFA